MTASDQTLAALGWSPDRESAFSVHREAGLIPGRVTSSSSATVATTAFGSVEVVLQRRFKREALEPTDLPAVGDWLALAPEPDSPGQAALRAVLPRSGAFVRQRSYDGRPQVLAANVDVAFLVSGLDHDLNLRRIERYLVLAFDGGVSPVVVLNKADVADDIAAARAAVDAVALGTPVIACSAATGAGLDAIRDRIGDGITACLLGSSGVGKSTITNALLGTQRQAVRALREDDSKGRHTTSHRELFVLEGGGLLIDTPGLRTVGVLGDAEALDVSFGEIERLARDCRFRDCQHGSEPGCAVRFAIDAHVLDTERLESYHKLAAERRSAEVRSDVRARRVADRHIGRVYRRAGRDAVRFKRGG